MFRADQRREIARRKMRSRASGFWLANQGGYRHRRATMPRAMTPLKWIAAALLLAAATSPATAEKISVLFVDGQNNHNWKAMTPYMKAQMEKTELFEVDVLTSPPRAPRPPRN
ncbi:MAG: hypothetical protein CMO68_01190, partial [Verrucomicrobiales bacterium]|nr:hypothetical protein [Verrucomicrobiales bacterium]